MELLISVAVISVISALVVPTFLQSRIAANEALAIRAVGNVVASQISYSMTMGSGSYTTDLKISLKEMISTLALIERLFQQRPADYVQSAPLLWLTVVKDISLEKGNARSIERLGLVRSNWPSIVDISLPRLFSRILEPKLTEFLRRGEK
jgi:competence protein ComGC